jgi:hypothetical protein
MMAFGYVADGRCCIRFASRHAGPCSVFFVASVVTPFGRHTYRRHYLLFTASLTSLAKGSQRALPAIARVRGGRGFA